MSAPMTLPATLRPTSSRALAAGPLQLDLLDFLTTARFGPDHAPANPSPSQARALEPAMSATSGPSSSALSAPVDRMLSWESRLRQRLERIGSTECILTWRASATPAGRPLSRLVPSMRPIAETASGLWPTPTSLAPARNGNNEAVNSAGLVAIRAHALAALWSTPTTNDAKNCAAPSQFERNSQALNVQVVAQNPAAAAMWPTPAAHEFEGGDPAKMWARREREKAKGRNGNGFGLTIGMLTTAGTGAEQSGLSEQTGKPGALAPEFVAWLMGFPPEWLECAPEKNPTPRFKKSK